MSIDMLPKGKALDVLGIKRKVNSSNDGKSWSFIHEKELLEIYMPRYYRKHGVDALIKAYEGWYKGFTHRLVNGRWDKEQQSILRRADELIQVCKNQIVKYRNIR